ncbi:M20 family metallopeptidase [Paenibacillus sp. GCM10012307]|uniref:Amidohydrolase n=1 Tax=Paenibacillus roseus TaxID=2798579 RepID=A0A934J6R2_9BACL|nr:amidohydrolase [Paenibacillus roseus]MBJ6362764.1 amidohydrolase [Paenibacillus roseus]
MSIYEAALKWKDEAIKLRRHIHQHPELSNQEFATAELVAEFLTSLDIEVERIGPTGVAGLLRGSGEGPVFGIRADMDALPIEEQTGLPFASVNSGIMHACGHDMHTAILLGTAAVLSERREQIKGTVKFVFQPAEEVMSGASNLVEGGVLDNPKVDAMIALHVWPDAPAGTIALKKGAMLAAADAFEIRIVGKGGHAAYPHRTVDPVIIAAQVISALQTIVSRNVSPLDPAVISITQLSSSSQAFNIIANEVRLGGTVRTHHPDVRSAIPKQMEKLATAITESFGGQAEFIYSKGVSPVINDERIIDIIEEAASSVLGREGVVYLKEASMGGEDFGAYLEHIPGAMFRLGTVAEDDHRSRLPLHHESIIFDERAMVSGIAVLAETALHFFRKEQVIPSRHLG